jgi:hypothetical protein
VALGCLEADGEIIMHLLDDLADEYLVYTLAIQILSVGLDVAFQHEGFGCERTRPHLRLDMLVNPIDDHVFSLHVVDWIFIVYSLLAVFSLLRITFDTRNKRLSCKWSERAQECLARHFHLVPELLSLFLVGPEERLKLLNLVWNNHTWSGVACSSSARWLLQVSTICLVGV